MKETPQQYAQRVVGYLEGKDPVEVLSITPRELQKLIKGASKKSLDVRPDPDKWAATMILAHLADSEIVLCVPPATHAGSKRRHHPGDRPGCLGRNLRLRHAGSGSLCGGLPC
jgi:hypothetical protein